MKIRRIVVAAVTSALLLMPGVTPVGAALAVPAGLTAVSAADSAGAVSFAWEPVDGASAYHFEAAISTSSTPIISTSTYVTTYTSVRALGNEDGSRELYWRVAAYGNGTQTSSLGQWSNWSLYIPEALGVPTLLQPAEDANHVYPTPVVFQWDPVPGATQYRVSYIAGEYGTSSGAEVTALTSATSFAPVTPLQGDEHYASNDGTQYSWRVQALIYDGSSASASWSSWSDTRSFSVSWPLERSQPTLLQPANIPNSTTVVADPVFAWEPVTGASRYRLEYAKTADLTGATTVVVSGTNYVPADALTNGNHYWRVTALDASGSAGTPSATWQFYKNLTDSSEPNSSGPTSLYEIYPEPITGVPGTQARLASDMNLVVPQQIRDNGGVMTRENFLLEWHPVPRATFYQVEVKERGGQATVLTCNTASTQATIQGASNPNGIESGLYKGAGACLWSNQYPIHPGNTYTWRVRAVNYDANASTVITASPSTTSITTDWSDEEVVGQWSRERWFVIDHDSSPRSANVAIDLERSGPNQPEALLGESAPYISWTPFDFSPYLCGGQNNQPQECTAPSNETETEKQTRLSELARRTGYEVQIYAKGAGSSTQVAYVRTFSTHIRPTGVFKDNEVTEPYSIAVRPVYTPTGNTLPPTANTNVVYPSGWTGERFVWSRTSALLDVSPVPVTTDDGTVFLQWGEQSTTAPHDGGSRGYAIKIFSSGGGQIGGSTGKKIEYPRFVAQNSATGQPLATGQYTYSVAALDANGDELRYSTPKPFTISVPTPAQLEVVNVRGSSAALTWVPSSFSVKYSVRYRIVGSDAWTTLTRIGNSDIKQTAVVLADLGAGTYEWQVASVDAANNTSAWSTIRNFTLGGKTVALETANDAVLAPATQSLSWTAVPDASRYLVLIARDQQFTSLVDTIETVATIATTTRQLAAGTQYFWKVRALPTKQASGANRPALGESLTRTFSVRTVPGKLTRPRLSVEGSGILVSWKELTGADAGTTAPLTYRIEYRVKDAVENSDDWSDADSVNSSSGATTWQLGNLKQSVMYQVRVAAVNSEGQGPWSDIVESRTASHPTAAPKVTLTAKLGALDVRIGAVASSGNGGSAILGYKLRYKRTAESSYREILLTSNQRQYSLTGLTNNTSYDVSVLAYNGVGDGPAAGASASTLGVASAPRDLRAKNGDGSVTVSWIAPANPAGEITGYVVEYREGTSGSWKGAGSTRPNTTTYTRTRLTNGKNYQFRVAARTRVGVGQYSAPTTATPAGKPVAPAKVTAKSNKKGKITVKWSKAVPNGSKLTRYTLQFSVNGKKWKKVKNFKPNKRKANTTKGKRGKTVQFRVIAQNKLGKSLPSRTVSVLRR